MRCFRHAEWEDFERLLAICERVRDAERLGGTFSCESANDLVKIASYVTDCISNRDAALLRYYAERIELENGAATTLDHAIAKALLALHDGATPADALSAINDAIRAWNAALVQSPATDDATTTQGAASAAPLTADEQAYALDVLSREPEVPT